jgi:hypothetical protein
MIFVVRMNLDTEGEFQEHRWYVIINYFTFLITQANRKAVFVGNQPEKANCKRN